MVSSRVRPVALAIGLAAIAAGAFLLRTLRNGTPAVDFAPVWLAGRMWNDGVDPYTAEFVPYAHRFFPPPAHLPVSWVYPSQWMAPARLLALLDYEQAKIVWLALSLAALAVSALLLWRAADRLARPPSIGVKAGAILFLLTMEATGASLFLGQTGFLMLLGVALLLYGLAGGRGAAAVAGLVLLFLKPQFGIVFATAALAVPALRLPTLAAGALTGLACLIGQALSPLGLVPSILAWLGAVGSYNDNPFNAGAALTGPILLMAHVSAVGISPLAYTGLAALAAPALVRWLGRGGRMPALDAFWLSAVAAVAAIVPLHTYDFSFAVVLLFAVAGFPRAGQGLLLAGMVLLHRARTIGGIVAPDADILHSQAAVATAGAMALLAAVATAGLARPAR